MSFVQRHARALALLMSAGALTLVVLAVMMGSLWGLNACYLCIFQRLLHFSIALALFVAWWRWRGYWAPRMGLSAAALVTLVGIGVAGYQSWLQWFPSLELGCGAGSQNPVERLVEWLAQWSSTLFMAIGFCDDDKFRIFGLSFANWSFFAFGAFFAACLVLYRQLPATRR